MIEVRRFLGAGFVCAMAACSEEAAPTAPTTLAPSPTATSASVDRAATCKTACQRAASCGVETAQSIAASKRELALVAERKADASKIESACIAECQSGDSAEADVAATHRCLEQTSCELFAKCLGGIGPDTAR